MVFGSCEQSSTEWCSVKINGVHSIGQNIRINDMLFISPTNGFLFGGKSEATWKGEKLIGTYTGLIFHSSDGGETWSLSIMEAGTFNKAYFNGQNVYALKVIQSDKSQPSSSEIYKYDAVLGVWEKYATVNSYVRDFAFWENFGVITAKDSTKKNQFYRTFNEGLNWELVEYEGLIHNPIFKNKTAIYFTSDQGNIPFYNKIIFYDFEKSKKVEEDLPEGLSGYFVSESKGEVWVIGVLGDKISLFKRGKGKYELVNSFESNSHFFPKKLHVNGNEIFIQVGERKDGYIYNKVYRSKDSGSTWIEEKLVYPLYADPISFYDEGDSSLIWIYSGTETIQRTCNQIIFQ